MGMTPEAVLSTLPLSKGDILYHTRNFLPYQAYRKSVITSSWIEYFNKFIIYSSIAMYWNSFYMTMTSMK